MAPHFGQWRKVGGAAGIASVVLGLVPAALIADEPRFTDSGREIMVWYAHNGNRWLASTLVIGDRDGVAVLTLVGEHDLSTSEQLRSAIREHAEMGRGVVVNLSQAEFIDSHVAHNLFHGDIEMLHRGRRLVIQNDAGPGVEGVLELKQAGVSRSRMFGRRRFCRESPLVSR